MTVKDTKPWVKFECSGKAFFTFNHKPKPADPTYGKPPMFVTELQLTDESELRINGDAKVYTGIADIKNALKGIYVSVKNLEGTTKAGEEWSRPNIIKFQSKVSDDTSAASRKPVTVDAEGNPFPESILIANESFVFVKSSIPDYRGNPPAPGRRALSPTFDGLQVIDLIEYKRDGGDVTGPRFKAREGYKVGDTTKVVVDTGRKVEAESEEEDGDVFASLETPLPASTTTTTKKKRAA